MRELTIAEDAPRQPRSIAQQIADYLSETILQGKYVPGQAIIEQELADKFGVSRGPVREAFRILETEGVLVINPRRSVHVTNLTIEEVVELFQIRAALFGLSGRLCAQRRSQESIRVIEEANEAIQRFVPSESTAEQYSILAAGATRTIILQCGNKRVILMLNRLSRQIHRYSLLGLSSVARQAQSISSFATLVTAIREGRGDEARQAATQMVNNTGNFAARMLSNSEVDQVS